MKKPSHTIPAGQFKAQCLKLMDKVKTTHASYVITKHGHPVAKLIPINESPMDLFGCLQNTISIHGNILDPIDIAWEENQ